MLVKTTGGYMTRNHPCHWNGDLLTNSARAGYNCTMSKPGEPMVNRLLTQCRLIPVLPIISRRQGRGTFVRDAGAPLDLRLGRISELTNPIEVMETRLALEPAAARLAAIRASRRDMDRLASLAAETRATRTPAEYERANTAFHRRVTEAARNALYLALSDAVNEILRDLACERLTESGHCFNRQKVYSDFHDQIVGAIAARDGDKAEALMYSHLRDVQQNLLARVFPVAE